jgi:MFS transporter, YNFM family, putative membrane transport protein
LVFDMEGATAPLVSGTREYRKLSLALVIAGLATFSVLYSVQALLPALAASFHVSAEAASLVVSTATGAMALTLLVASVISDRIGRQQLMTGSLFAAAALTVLSAALPGWHTLLITRFFTGIALAGIPAVAMAYVAEEVHPSSIGGAMGLYIAGAAIGGMAGRLGASILCDIFGWRVALAGVGLSGLIGAAVFSWAAPPSRAFVARKHDWRSFLDSAKSLGGDAALPWLYAEAFLLMGAFVTIYNYAGFHLLAPPYSLSQTAVGAIFLFYIVGSFSSTWFGQMAGRLGRRLVFWIPILILLGGVALTTLRPLICIILGIGVATFGYFGAHSVASSWVSRRGLANSAQAAAFYLCFLYIGSSILGSAGGIAWSRAGWLGVAAFTGTLVLCALAIAIRLVAVKPLPQNVVVTEKVDAPSPL